MNRYEANSKGGIEAGEPFTRFNEFNEFEKILIDNNWNPAEVGQGQGGYYLFKVFIDSKQTFLHTYLKKVTFGGRENRPYEKRAQFSAALDRRGFKATSSANTFKLILALYKSSESSETIICAWDTEDWGYNEGRAFNCFIDVRVIAQSIKTGFAQHRTSIGQIACCFKPEWFLYYLNNKDNLHKRIIENPEPLTNERNVSTLKDDLFSLIGDGIPKFDDLFQVIIDILKNHEGIASVSEMEEEAADIFELTDTARQTVHNADEGYRTELGYRLAWARNYLKRAGLIESPKRSIWMLTEAGQNIMFVNKEEIKKITTERDVTNELIISFLNNVEGEDDIEIEKNEENNEIEHPFDPNLVDIKTRTMSMDLILKRLYRGEINLNTSFQRKAGLWDIIKQSRLIESILVKFPLPAFYFDGSDDNNWLVVDGLQRLSSLDNYVNKRTFGLQKMEFLSQFNGKKFNELPPYLQRRIEEFEITSYIIAQGTPKVLKFNVFKRINTGGLTLTSQEIRNALNQGRSADFIRRLADMRSFKIATTFSISEDRMLDREFVTRFLAFYIFPLEEYKSDMDSFLNSAMDTINNMSQSRLEEIAVQFNIAMQTAFKLFGEDAFRKRYNKTDKRKPINKALFEVWSVLISRLQESEIKTLVDRKNTLINNFIELLNKNQDFNLAITSGTSDRVKVKKRFDEINNIIKTTIL